MVGVCVQSIQHDDQKSGWKEIADGGHHSYGNGSSAIREKYKDIIVPQAGMVGYRYLVSSYVMQNTDLIHVQAYITAVGTMELMSEVLEKNLPVDFGA
jgi:hypothetical protein